MLKNLNTLGLSAKAECEKYNKTEFTLSDEFKSEISKIITTPIKFFKNTAVVTTSENLNILLPNQWIAIAAFFSDYLVALKEYKTKSISILGKTGTEREKFIKEIKDSKIIPDNIKRSIRENFDNEEDIAFFERFLTDYSWWFGSKTIDRSDYFVSPVLNLSNSVNVSQSYIADLANIISERPDLINIIRGDLKKTIEEDSYDTNIEEILIEETNSIRDFAFSIFKHFYGKNWLDLINQTSTKTAHINSDEYIGRDFSGFPTLLGDFSSSQTKEELTSGGTQRYFEEPIYEADGRYFYFTMEWYRN